MNAPATLAAIRDEGSGKTYPQSVLQGCESALVLFAAGFHGRQDGYWIAEAGLKATCVDVDVEKLSEMAALYPADWEFVVADAYEFAEETGEMWDVVSIDCPSNHLERCAELVPRWCDLARRAVVVGATYESSNAIPQMPGWKLTDVRRRSDFLGGVYWAVLEAV